ncbi:MAG: hypothetical protein RMK79_03150 [Anaerolineae bacterium]|nr:hypothetical protein [Anaerolineae bacterium]
MTLEDAIREIAAACRSGRSVSEAGKTGYRIGKVFVDTGGLQRGVTPCPLCGALMGMGSITVRHDDGRTVHFSLRLFHYAEAGHPITSRDVNGKLLIAIMSEA